MVIARILGAALLLLGLSLAVAVGVANSYSRVDAPVPELVAEYLTNAVALTGGSLWIFTVFQLTCAVVGIWLLVLRK